MQKNYVAEVNAEALSISSKISDEKFLSSTEYRNYLRSYITGVISGYSRLKRIVVEIIADPTNPLTASTNGEVVYTNTMDPIINGLPTRAAKHYANVGKVCHEIWHLMFTDFMTHQKKMSQILSNTNKFDWFIPLSPAVKYQKETLNRINNDPAFKQLFLSVFKDVNNILEDGYINRKGSEVMPGVPASGVNIMLMQMASAYGSTREIFTKPLLSAFMQYLHLSYFGIAPKDKTVNLEDLQKFNFVQDILHDIEPLYKAYLYEKSGNKRSRIADEVMCGLYPLLDKVLQEIKDQQGQNGQNGQNGQSGQKDDSNSNNGSSSGSNGQSQGSSQSGQSSNGQQTASNGSQTAGANGNDQSSGSQSTGNGASGTDSTNNGGSSGKGEKLSEQDILNAISSMIDEMQKSMQETKLPEQQNSKPIEESENGNDSANNTSSDPSNSEQSENGMTEAMQKAFEQVLEEICKEMAEKKVEAKHTQDLREEAFDIKTAINQDIPGSEYYDLNIRRKNINNPDEQLFQRMIADQQETISNTVRSLKKILQEKSHNRVTSGYRMGKLDVKSIAKSEYYQDGKIFKRKNEKEQKKVAFSLLIDQSGSMSGYKRTIASKTAIVLEEILRQLDVPLFVAGHCDRGCEIPIDVYVDWQQIDNNDRYRLMYTTSEGCNEDSVAISYCCQKLLERPEEEKVLIVISDGQPNGSVVMDSMSAAVEVVQKYRQKKIHIFGAVIDSDFNRIQKIYGDYCLDCRAGEGSLGTELVGLIKRYVARK